MNQFEYIVEIEHLNTLKTKKSREAFVRKYFEIAKAVIPRWGGIALSTFEENKYAFKALTAGLSKSKDIIKRLPQTTLGCVSSSYTKILTLMCENDYTYEDICDIFEYVDLIEYPLVSNTYLKFINLIADNSMPFKIPTSIYTDHTYSYLYNSTSVFKPCYLDTASIITDVGPKIPELMANIATIEHLKEVLIYDKPITYTVIENELESLYKSLSRHVKSPKSIIESFDAQQETHTRIMHRVFNTVKGMHNEGALQTSTN